VRSLITRFASSVAVLALAAACGSSPTSPATGAPFSQTDLTIGAGAAAASGDSITVNYTGWLFDSSKPDNKGIQFDTSAVRGPFTFTLGTGKVIKGWDQGLISTRVGGVRRLVIPPSLGYGSLRQGPIPPNSTLVFDVELVSIQVAGG
jgi:FKBP-type peptidyl-prolyl cis-trans isomerase FkpA